MLKMYWKVEIELCINDNTKAFKYKPFLSFWACQKKIVELTDLIHTFYWPEKNTDKKDNLDNLSLYVSTKYIPNNVGVSWHFHNMDHIWIIFRPEEKTKK